MDKLPSIGGSEKDFLQVWIRSCFFSFGNGRDGGTAIKAGTGFHADTGKPKETNTGYSRTRLRYCDFATPGLGGI
jgi:hypothetical protein